MNIKNILIYLTIDTYSRVVGRIIDISRHN